LVPYASVEFIYTTDRPDVTHHYFKGVEMVENRRLDKIVMSLDGSHVHDYRFEYSASEAGKSLLESVQQFFTTEGAATPISLPKTRFEFDEHSQADDFTYTSAGDFMEDGLDFYESGGHRFLSGDFNGDGLDDMCVIGSSESSRWIALSEGRSPVDGSAVFDFAKKGYEFLPQRLKFDKYSIPLSVDFNGDGLTDICALHYYEDYRWVGISNGDGSFDFTEGYEFLPERLHANSDGGKSAVLPGDFNGDGLMDLFCIGYDMGNASGRWVGLYNENGSFTFTDAGTLAVPADLNGYLGSYGCIIQTGDFNGDDKTDVFCVYDNPSGCVDKRWVGLSDGDGSFTFTKGYDFLPSDLRATANGCFVQTGDFNGDGLTDISCVGNGDHDASFRWLGLSNGNGTFSYPKKGYDFLPLRLRAVGSCAVVSGDFNGDGLTDLFSVGNEEEASSGYFRRWVGLSRGDGSLEFVEGYNALPANLTAWAGGAGSEVRAGDFNGDGLTDVCSMAYDENKRWIGLSDGDGTFTYTYSSSADNISCNLRTADTDLFYCTTGDFDGDGMPDLLSLPKNNPYFYSYEGRVWLGFNNNISVRLTKVTQGWRSATEYGSVTEVEYLPITDSSIYIKDTGAVYPIRDIISPTYVVSTLSKDDGVGGKYYTDYTYRGAKQHLHGRGFLGFYQFESYDRQKQMSYTEILAQDFPFTGSTLRKDTCYIPDPDSDPADPGYTQLVHRVDNDWFCDLVDGGTLFAYNPRTVEEKYVRGEVTPYATVTALKWYDLQETTSAPPTEQPTTLYSKITHGNLVQSHVDYGGGLEQTTVNTYDDWVDDDHWMLGRIATTKTTYEATGQDDVVRKKAFDYYEDTGLPYHEVIEPDDPEYELETIYYYTDASGNNVGNVERKSVSGAGIAARNVVDVDYDAKGRFVETSRNALSHETVLVNDQTLGKPLSSTDPNSLLSEWDYDELGRTEREDRPDGTYTTQQYSWDSTSFTVPADADLSETLTQKAFYKIETQTAGAAPVTVWYDVLGREIRSQTLSADGSTVNKDTGYNALGQQVAVSDPYFSGDTPVYTYTQYDPLDRLQFTTAPDGTVSELVYNGLTTQTIADSDERAGGKNLTTTTVKNAKEELVSVTDHLNGTMSYTYDGAGQLVKTTAPDANIDFPDSNVTVIEYDVLGNKYRQDDPDMGEWFYTYNALTQLVAQVDAVGNTIESSYDLLGRPETRTNWAMTTAGLSLESTAAWFYDGTGEGAKLGMLRREEYRDGEGAFINRKTYAYDAYSRPMLELRNYDSKWYYTTLRYDAYGRVEYVDRFWRPMDREGSAYQLSTSWNSFQTINTYNQYGFMLSVSDGTTTWWQCTESDYDEQGRITGYAYGNGLASRVDYNPLTGRIDNSYIDGLLGTEVSDYGFVYDRLGNLEERSHERPSMTTLIESCTYDELNRLKTTTVGSTTATTTYDALGNIQTRTGITGTYGYGSSRPHAVTTAGDCTYYYDANGNIIRRDRDGEYECSISWNSFNKPVSIFSGLVGSEFEYDVNGQRTQQIIYEDYGSVRKKIYVAETYEHEETLTNPTETDRSLWVWSLNHTRIYVDTPVGKVGIYEQEGASGTTGTVTKNWTHKDPLGSVIAVSDAAGTLTWCSFDAWGNRRNADDWTESTDPASLAPAATDRGYTGHEQLDHLELVHMNGRIYDPVIARFISPDPFIQFPDNSQSYNRYSYVMNRPLSFNDPSGFLIPGVTEAFIVANVTLVGVISARNISNRDVVGEGNKTDAASLRTENNKDTGDYLVVEIFGSAGDVAQEAQEFDDNFSGTLPDDDPNNDKRLDVLGLGDLLKDDDQGSAYTLFPESSDFVEIDISDKLLRGKTLDELTQEYIENAIPVSIGDNLSTADYFCFGADILTCGLFSKAARLPSAIGHLITILSQVKKGVDQFPFPEEN
jgi:RHS repeat-associated protein